MRVGILCFKFSIATYLLLKWDFVLRYLRTIFLSYACIWPSNMITSATIPTALPCHCTMQKRCVTEWFVLLSPLKVMARTLRGCRVNSIHSGDGKMDPFSSSMNIIPFLNHCSIFFSLNSPIMYLAFLLISRNNWIHLSFTNDTHLIRK